MTDASGVQIGETMKYLPFGETLSGAVPTDKKFTGQRLDATGLYYYGARYYDPSIGRFTGPDTVIPSPNNPQKFNRYTYCSNNPLKYVDPSGHDDYMALMQLAEQYRLNKPFITITEVYFEKTITTYAPFPVAEAFDKVIEQMPKLPSILTLPLMIFDIFTEVYPPKIPIATTTIKGSVTVAQLPDKTTINTRINIQGEGIKAKSPVFQGIEPTLTIPQNQGPSIRPGNWLNNSGTIQSIPWRGAQGGQGFSYGSIEIPKDIKPLTVAISFSYTGNTAYPYTWFEPFDTITIDIQNKKIIEG